MITARAGVTLVPGSVFPLLAYGPGKAAIDQR